MHFPWPLNMENKIANGNMKFANSWEKHNVLRNRAKIRNKITLEQRKTNIRQLIGNDTVLMMARRSTDSDVLLMIYHSR